MTTHEARTLRPYTAVYFVNATTTDIVHLDGVARPNPDASIRVVWNDLAHPDSVVRVTDDVLLSTIHITQIPPDAP